MSVDRRTLIAGGLALGLPSPASAQAGQVERIPLWPGTPPGGEGLGIKDETVQRSPAPDDIAWPHIGTPVMTVARPAQPNGSAVLLMPGGGYTRVAVGRGPSRIARLWAERGVTAFELLYRLPHDGWKGGPDTPLQDAQRAMRLIRAGAAKWRIQPERVAAIGFSAGGHLVGSLGTRHDARVYAPIDAADAQSARPIAIGMFFPVVTMIPPVAHAPSRRELLGPNPSDALADRYSLELNVPATMPPTLVCHAADDKSVPMANSLRMFDALQAARIPSELVIAEKGGHGIPLVTAEGKFFHWFDVFQALATRHGWIDANG